MGSLFNIFIFLIFLIFFFLQWLDDCEFLEQLIGQLNGETTSDTRANVCQLLCDLVLNNRENVNKDKSEEDPILKKIES